MQRPRVLRRTILIAAGLGLAAVSALAWRQSTRAPGAGPAPVFDLLYARPFRLEQPYVHRWRLERPAVSGGWIVVLAIDRELGMARQVAEPVLYVGRQTAERVNFGGADGQLVAIVPSPLDAQGQPLLDLAGAPMWFGSPELPERIDAARIEHELAQATERGVAALPRARVQAARATGGEPLVLADRSALRRMLGELVLRYAPAERDLATGLLAPPPE